MGVVALAEPQRVKISSKRQVTIPARWYREMGFDEYALATWTEDGLLLQPISVDDEDVTVDILRQLIAEGYKGDELIDEYCKVKSKIISVKSLIAEAEEDMAAGHACPASVITARMREKHGLCG